MKISWNSLNQYIDLNNISVKEVANKLTLAGFEVENIVYKKDINDIVLDINITANRQDLKSFVSIATELSAILRRPLKFKRIFTNIKQNTQIKDLDNSYHLDLFSDLYICLIDNIPIKYTNQKLKNNLKIFEIQTTDSILDIINLINLKWGLSINIYGIESDITSNKNFKFTNNKKTLQIFLNNHNLIKISEQNINNHKHISKFLLIQHKYNKDIEKDYTEKYINSSYCLYAFLEILSILQHNNTNSKVPKEIYRYIHKKQYNKYIKLDINTINKLLGPICTETNKKFLKQDIIVNILKTLKFNTEYNKNTLTIKIPKERENDISNTVDIIEEIARIYGFNKFKDYLPKFQNRNRANQKNHTKQKIRRILRSMGLHEVINYSLQEENYNSLNIVNALNQEQKNLRNNLINNLISNKIYNVNQKNNNFETFEIGTVFIQNTKHMQYEESLHLSCLLGKADFHKSSWEDPKYSLTWFQAKGQIEELFEKIYAKVSWSTTTQDKQFLQIFKNYKHPKRTIYITNHNKTIGILSQINNRIYKTIGASHRIYFLEINLNELNQTINSPQTLEYIYSSYSNYPKVTRDFSITIHKRISMEKINNIIDKIIDTKNDVIESISILNEYHNNHNTKTICLRTNYRSKFKTLTNKEIKILDNILKTELDSFLQSKT